MRWWQVLGVAAIAGCAAEAVPEPDAAGWSRPAPPSSPSMSASRSEAVAARFEQTGASGVSVVVVTDASGAGGERVHTCEVDAAGRVLAIRHPGA